MPHPFLSLLIYALLRTHPAAARLTHNGLPTGQTVALRGLDHFEHPFRIRRRASRPPSPRYRRRPSQCLSELSAFHTLHDTACGQAGRDHTVARLRAGNRTTRAMRLATSAQLSAIFARSAVHGREPVVVLFHGGSACEWSRALLPAWADAARLSRGVCMVAIDAARDSMLNYNLMVLGFPTVLRVRAEGGAQTFRGERSVAGVVRWVESTTNVQSMGEVADEEWLGEAALLDLTARDSWDWALVAASMVTMANVLWLAWWGIGVVRRAWTGKIHEE